MVLDTNDVVGEILEQGGSIVKHTATVGKNTPLDLIKTASFQIAKGNSNQSLGNDGKTSHTPEDKDDNSQEFVKALYGKKENGENQNQKNNNPEEQSPQKTKEEMQKIQALRQQLHYQTYFNPTFNRVKPKEEAVVERLEREKEEVKMKELEEERKKPPPLAIKQAQNIEKNRGASG